MFIFSGIASGLDTTSIIKQLVAVEGLPVKALESKKAAEKSKLDLVGTLKQHVKALQDAASELRTMDKFRSFVAQASTPGVASFDVSGSAAPGSHTLKVLSLAQVDRWTFDAVSDDMLDLASGPGELVSFTVEGTQYEVEIDPAESNIHQIASAINAEAGEAVSASVVNTGTPSSPSWQLVLTSKVSGEDGRISAIGSTVAGLTIDATPPDGQGQAQSANNITVGSNAVAIVDGLQVERATNKIEGVLTGVTIDLLSANGGEEITFTVSADAEAVKARVQSFVDAHNQVVSFINAQSAYDEDSGPGGKLFGDSLLTAVRREIRTALFGVDVADVVSDTEGYSTLGLVGIKVGNEGLLTIDDAIFDAKLSQNLDALADLFVDTDGFDNGGAAPNTPEYYQDITEDSGIAERLYRAIDRMLGSLPLPDGTNLKGLFESRTEALNATIKRFEQQIEQRELYLEKFEAGLVKRFAALEQVMGVLNAKGAALTNALESLQLNSNK